jgi:lipoprotein-anchoring transpeptidase ErfK/SrfK
VYAAAVAAAPDPATAAGLYTQEARNLSAALPSRAAAPARIPGLDSLYASATTVAGYARVGALAHLDVDALNAQLVQMVPPRAVAVSTEEQSLTCYVRGRAVYHSPVTADTATPTGVFHIQAKQASVPVIYWGGFRRYRSGTLPDWMPFSAGAALQGAPWRSVFGPGSDAFSPLYAPSTPGSVDLPPAAAQFVFGWASVGTEVVVY